MIILLLFRPLNLDFFALILYTMIEKERCANSRRALGFSLYNRPGTAPA